MPHVPPPQDPPAYVSTSDSWFGSIVRKQDWFLCDATRQFVGAFQVGDVLYKPRKRLTANFTPPFPGVDGRFAVADLPGLTGFGKTMDSARKNWELRADAMIQQLLGVQDFERTEEDVVNWKNLSECFDLAEIRYSTPLQVRNYGRLVSEFPRPWKVRWIDGTTSKLQRDQIPAELVRFPLGQEFEAVIEQDSRTGDLKKIVSVFRSNRVRVSTEEARELLANTGSPNGLPEASWD